MSTRSLPALATIAAFRRALDRLDDLQRTSRSEAEVIERLLEDYVAARVEQRTN